MKKSPAVLFRLVVILGIVQAQVVVAQPTSPNTTVPIRELSPVEIRSTVPLGAIVGLRVLPGGKLLVSDGGSRQLLLFDAQLTTRQVLLDSATVDGKGYGPTPTAIIPYLGDTTLFVDRESATLSVISPSGSILRVVAAPKPADIGPMAAYTAGADRNGNLIYRGVMPRDPGASAQASLASGVQPPDSAPIVRANFDTRSVDTLARLKTAGNVRAESVTEGDSRVLRVTVNPIVSIDDWALLSDGTVAIVRGQDYHVDVILPDGTRIGGPKLPFDWKRLTDTDKQKLLDSTRAANEKEKAATPLGMSLPNESGVVRVRMRPGTGLMIERRVVSASEIADYWPPIRYGATKADLDGNMWILPTTSAQSKAGELIYDVVNNRGAITHRVRLPVGRSVAGFGKGGIVYLMGRNGDKTWFLERTHVIP